jgi:hypothetical protein
MSVDLSVTIICDLLVLTSALRSGVHARLAQSGSPLWSALGQGGGQDGAASVLSGRPIVPVTMKLTTSGSAPCLAWLIMHADPVT